MKDVCHRSLPPKISSLSVDTLKEVSEGTVFLYTFVVNICENIVLLKVNLAFLPIANQRRQASCTLPMGFTLKLRAKAFDKKKSCS